MRCWKMLVDHLEQTSRIEKEKNWSKAASLWDTAIKLFRFGDLVFHKNMLLPFTKKGLDPLLSIANDTEIIIKNIQQDRVVNGIKGSA